jgi:hypothetical protein
MVMRRSGAARGNVLMGAAFGTADASTDSNLEIVDWSAQTSSGHIPRTNFEVDALRVYHSGARVVVEVEVVMSPSTTLRESHDACLAIQRAVESLEEVERAFVHADYAYRALPEHAGDLRRAVLRGKVTCLGLGEPREDVDDAEASPSRNRGERKSRPGRARLRSDVTLYCEEGEGPAFDTVATPLM